MSEENKQPPDPDPQIAALLNGINPTLSDEARAMAAMAMDGSGSILRSGNPVQPIVFFEKEHRLGCIALSSMANVGEKDAAAFTIRKLVDSSDVVAFITEVWVSRPDAPMPPSDDPNHTEKLMVHLYIKERTMMFAADIEREPNRVGDWKMFSDTADSKGPSMTGRFADLTNEPPKGLDIHIVPEEQFEELRKKHGDDQAAIEAELGLKTRISRINWDKP